MEPCTNNYTHHVPAECDTITWRGKCYSLPIVGEELTPRPIKTTATIAAIDVATSQLGDVSESMKWAIITLIDGLD